MWIFITQHWNQDQLSARFVWHLPCVNPAFCCSVRLHVHRFETPCMKNRREGAILKRTDFKAKTRGEVSESGRSRLNDLQGTHTVRGMTTGLGTDTAYRIGICQVIVMMHGNSSCWSEYLKFQSRLLQQPYRYVAVHMMLRSSNKRCGSGNGIALRFIELLLNH